MERLPLSGNQGIVDMPLELFSRCCQELKQMKTSHLTLLSEGESLLHRDIFTMIRLAKDAGLMVEMVTNGTLLGVETCRRITEAGLDKLKVSVWGGNREVYEKNYPDNDPENFDRLVCGLQALASIKAVSGHTNPSVTLHHPINKNNYDNLGALIKLAEITASDGVSFSPFYTHGGRLAELALSPDEEDAVRTTLADIRIALKSSGMRHNIDQVLLRYQVGENVWKRVPCYIGWLHLRIKMDGTVFPCNPCWNDLGNLRDTGLQVIWNDTLIREFRHRTRPRAAVTCLGNPVIAVFAVTSRTIGGCTGFFAG